MPKNKQLNKFFKSVWLFPAIGLLVLVILVSFKINGSSVGTYYSFLYGGSKDKSLIIGQPRNIRSDEWEWQLNMKAAQVKSGFPDTNKNIGSGQDMEAIVDAPYKNWTIIFKPHLLTFFVLPFAYAYAFMWWFLAFLLIVSCYFFILSLLPKKRAIAAGISLCLFFSPFVQWWYQYITLAPIFYTLFIIVVVIKLWESKNNRDKLLWLLILSYLLTAFSIILYPPFQIPCVLVAVFFLVAIFIEKGYFTDQVILKKGIKLTVVSLIIFAVCIFSFLNINKTAINATRQSVYPGKRTSTSGHFDAEAFFANFLDSQLQYTHKGENYLANQSEISNYILLAPFLIIPIIYMLTTEHLKKKPKDWPLIAMTLLFLLFMVRLFVPNTDLIFKLMYLGTVPNNRLKIGIGICSFFIVILFIRHLMRWKYKFSKIFILITTLLVFVFDLIIGLLTRRAHPIFIHNILLIVILSLIPALITGLLMNRKYLYSIGLFLVFSIGSAGLINPLYIGTGPIIGSNLTNQITAIGKTHPNYKWGIVDSLTLENLPAISDVPSISGIYAYPQLNLWSKSEVADQNFVYNRYAHTIIRFTSGHTSLILVQPDFFEISASPCSSFFKQENVKFFLAETNYSQTYSCLSLVKEVKYPAVNFYILGVK